MSDKQALLESVRALPDGATWGEITDALIAFIARRSGAILTAGQRAEIGAKLDSIPGADADIEAGRGVPHDEVLTRLRARRTAG